MKTWGMKERRVLSARACLPFICGICYKPLFAVTAFFVSVLVESVEKEPVLPQRKPELTVKFVIKN